MSNRLNTAYDDALKSVPIQIMTWLPWVGKKFETQCKHRLLIIGESHYGHSPGDISESLSNRNYTREVVQSFPINEECQIRFFNNLHLTLLGQGNFKPADLWEQISFFNIVQRPMDFATKERPTNKDFFKGWEAVVKVVEILKPTNCVVVGVAASNSFNNAMAAFGIPHEKVEWGELLNSTYIRKPVKIEVDGSSTSVHFIKHTSQFFSWGKWHDYLNEQLPELITALTESILACDHPEVESVKLPLLAEQNRTKGIPTWLAHKPVLASNYSDIARDESEDAKYISFGHAQYNDKCASIKIWRHSGKRWSRQSEEVPIGRLGHMMQMLLTAIKVAQSSEARNVAQSSMNEEVISDDFEFIRESIQMDGKTIRESLDEIRRLIDEIELEKI